MKHLLVIKVLVIAFIPLSAFCQQTNGFTIHGEMDGLVEGDKIILKMIEVARGDFKTIIVDSTIVRNGKFTITSFAPGGPRLFFVDLGGKTGKTIRLLLNNGEDVTIRGRDITKIKHGYLQDQLTVSGSPTDAAYHYLLVANLMFNQTMHRLNNLLKQMRDSVGFEPNAVSAIMAAKNELNESLYFNFFYEREDSDFKPGPLQVAIPSMIRYAAIDNYSGRAPFLMQTYNRLNDQEKQTYSGKILFEYARLSIGQPFPSFKLPQPDGKLLDLKDIVTKSKVTIVHFWANNSVDRQIYQDELRTMYKKYHDKGLNIVGFSSDNYADEWKKALQKSKFPWYNVSDLKGEDGMVEKVYHEYGDAMIHNTTNVLINQQGKIIAWDVSGIELQWYLWKAFDNDK